MKNKNKLHKILYGGYAVRSGVYTAIDPSIRMEMDGYGEYQYIFPDSINDSTYKKLLHVDMMSDVSANESEIAEDLFGDIPGIQYDSEVGYYTGLHAGHVKVGGFRDRASSGGMCSWILARLLEEHIVDGVIHLHAVEPKSSHGKLFEYTISRNQEEINKGAKSRYYPGELSQVLSEVKKISGKYAIVGIPEFIMELRLLAKIDPVIKDRIPIMLGLVCGHQKTAKYVESLAWQHGIKPGDLTAVDFRIKQPERDAMDYLHMFKGRIDGEEQTLYKSHSELFGEVWAHGFFKSKFSDFSDNVFNEVADVVLGDAWLPQYKKDGRGNNIVIVRNEQIQEIINDGISDGSLHLDQVDAELIKQSQRGLIHHGRDELGVRIGIEKRGGRWVPKKRFDSRKSSLIRRSIQNIRYKMARKSHRAYKEAVLKCEWSVFKNQMIPMIHKYNWLYSMKGGALVQQREQSLKSDTEFVFEWLRLKLRVRTRLRQLKQTTRVRTRIREYIKNKRIKRDAQLRQSVVDNPQGAILTLTDYHNYGNMLQRYALQKFLMNHNYRLISYAQEALDVRDKKFDKFRNTINFVEQRIPRKEPNKNDNFDIYITGSDQVWRKWGGADEKLLEKVRYYFFDSIGNTKAKRIAYAASFGHDNIEQAGLTPSFMESIKPLVKEMDAISVREESGVDIAKKWWSVEPSVVLDPTMLLTKKDYNNLIENSTSKLIPSKQMFAYVVYDQEKRRMDDIRYLEGVYGLSSDATSLLEIKVLPPVEQWLQNIRDADLVVTDSFHGAVFCVLNNTPFIVLVNKFGGVSRIETLLGKLGLEDRILYDDDIKSHTSDSMNPINWTLVNKRVRSLRKSSSSWLLNSIKGNDRT